MRIKRAANSGKTPRLELPDQSRFAADRDGAIKVIRHCGISERNANAAYREIKKSLRECRRMEAMTLKEERALWSAALEHAKKLSSVLYRISPENQVGDLDLVDDLQTFIERAQDRLDQLTFKSPEDILGESPETIEALAQQPATPAARAAQLRQLATLLDEATNKQTREDRGEQPAVLRRRALLNGLTRTWILYHPAAKSDRRKPVSKRGEQARYAGPLLDFVIAVLEFEDAQIRGKHPRHAANILGKDLCELMRLMQVEEGELSKQPDGDKSPYRSQP